jgi:hypothetical protein
VSLTLTGSLMGTPRYMAPEQHLGQALDARADQFAFCVALYEAWYRQPPFAGIDYDVMVSHVLAGEVQPPPPGADVPPGLHAVVLRGLRRQRAERYPSMQELLDALVGIADARETQARARAEQMGQLEAQRVQHELELRRREIDKRRTIWLFVTVSAALIGVVIAIVIMVQNSNAKDAADRRRRDAEHSAEKDRRAKERAQADQRELARQLDEVNATVADLNKEMAEAGKALAAASTKADRDRVAAQQAAIRRKQAEAQARINKIRAGVKLKCPPEQPLC